jgi:hypothetical protein
MLEQYFSANPIARAELVYQTRSRPQVRRWKRVATRITLIAALTLACILAGGEFAGVVLYRDPDPISRAFGVLNILPVATAFILHFVLMIQTLSLSANSVAREKQANNWDMLVLTGIDARQIIRGKWWATVRRMWPSYAFLGVLRAAVIIWFGASVSRVYEISLMSFNYYGGNIELILPSASNFGVAAVSIFALTMINLPFTAACGVSAISARTRSSALTLGRAIGTRLLILLAPSLMGFLLAFPLALWRSQFFAQIGGGTLVTLIDNGLSVGNQLVGWEHTDPYVDTSDKGDLVVVVFLALAAYLLFTVLLLRIAQWQATRHNALPPLSSTSAKTTYNA